MCASVDGVRRMTIAWLGFLCTISKPFHKLHPHTHCCTVHSRSTSAYHVVALCEGEVAAQSQPAHLRVREEHIKMQTNHVVCDQTQHGVPEVEANGHVHIRG